MIQMSALTLDWGNRAPIRYPWAVICSFHREQTREGEKGQKHPSNGHFPDPNTWIFLPSHKTTAPPNWRHSSDTQRSGKSQVRGASPSKPQVPRLPEAQRFPAQLERASKAKKHSPSTSPGRRQTQRGNLSRPILWTNQGQSGEAPRTAQASVSVQRESPLPEATSAATALLPSCFTSLVPTSANSPLWRLPPASRPATHHRHAKERRTVQCHCLSSPLSVLIPTPPPLPCPPNSQLREYSFLGLTASQTHIIHSFIQLASEGF